MQIWGGEIAQLVKYLIYKCKYLSYIPKLHGIVACICNPSTEGSKMIIWLRLAGQPAYQIGES